MQSSPRRQFMEFLAPTSTAPLALEIHKAEHIYLYDGEGKAYIDLIAGIAVSNVGHRHPKVLEAIQAQSERYLHLMVYGEYVQAPQVQLAEALVQSAGCERLEQVYFCNSGTEATEGAMKLAKRATGRSEFIACHQAYHGASQGALSLAGSEDFKQAFRPLLPGIKHIHHGHWEDLEQITHKTAAVFIEIIAGEAGVRIPPAAYFQALEAKCRATGTLLIIDEIQSGFGRSGHFWAFQAMGIAPDVLLCAKGMGGGLPLGAFLASKELMQLFTHQPVLGHITTFGGHPLSCAASLASLNLIHEEDLANKALNKGALFKQYLVHPLIKDVRGQGLMMAMELADFPQIQSVIRRCLDLGMITDWFLFCDHSLRIAPPLVIEEEEIKKACNIMLQALDEEMKAN